MIVDELGGERGLQMVPQVSQRNFSFIVSGLVRGMSYSISVMEDINNALRSEPVSLIVGKCTVDVSYTL